MKQFLKKMPLNDAFKIRQPLPLLHAAVPPSAACERRAPGMRFDMTQQPLQNFSPIPHATILRSPAFRS